MNHDAFLSDILENPDDDAPRLICADWLDLHPEVKFAVYLGWPLWKR
jgi:uncharacterized protein (TIGR02996 family)